MPWHTTLKKLAKNPVGAIRHSKYFKRISTEKVIESDNLFFAANLGQLGQIHSFINFEALTSNQLCILYTAANKRMPKIMIENADYFSFKNVFIQRIPIRPSKVKIRNFIYIERAYRDIIKKTNPRRIFLQSFETHYALIASIANELDIELHLLEEGVGTYKFDKQGTNLSPALASDQHKFRQAIIRKLPIFRNIRPALTTARGFTAVHVAFPELLENAFNARFFTRFFLYAPGNGRSNLATSQTIKKYNINKNDLIYLSQKYRIDDELFSNHIIDTLARMAAVNGARVVMKLHPKESNKTLEVFKAAIAERHIHEAIILIEENDFLIEPCIATVKPRAIIGLTSTALAYSTLISRDSGIVSITPYLLKMLDRARVSSDNQARFVLENPGIQELKNHLTIIGKFTGIRFITDESGLDLDEACSSSPQLAGLGPDSIISSRLTEMCQNLTLDATQNARWQFDRLDSDTSSANDEVLQTKALVEEKLEYFVERAGFSHNKPASNHAIREFLAPCHSGHFVAARESLDKLEIKLGSENIKSLGLEADLASALLDEGYTEEAQRLVNVHNQALIEGSRIWLYIAARIYASQGKYWKAHCHFIWSLKYGLDKVGLKPLCELLENSNHLSTHENLDDILITALAMHASSNKKCAVVKRTLEESLNNSFHVHLYDSGIKEFRQHYLKIVYHCSKADINYAPLKSILVKNLLLEEKNRSAFIVFLSIFRNIPEIYLAQTLVFSLFHLILKGLQVDEAIRQQTSDLVESLDVSHFEKNLMLDICVSKERDFRRLARSINREEMVRYLNYESCNLLIISILIKLMTYTHHIGALVDIFMQLPPEILENSAIKKEKENLYIHHENMMEAQPC